MPLLTKKNLQTREAAAGAVLAGIVGLLTVIITNIDKITDAYTYFTEVTEAKQAKGSWLGVFREYDDTKKDYIISNESVNLNASHDLLSGTIDSAHPALRHHDVKGNLRSGFVILEYREDKPPRTGAVVYLLNGRVELGVFTGYWTGYDPDERAIMSCPYVLTRQTDPAAVHTQFKDWLNKACAR